MEPFHCHLALTGIAYVLFLKPGAAKNWLRNKPQSYLFLLPNADLQQYGCERALSVPFPFKLIRIAPMLFILTGHRDSIHLAFKATIPSIGWLDGYFRCIIIFMNTVLSPIISEFETEEQAASYDRWFRAQVQASLDDPRPSIPHDEVMAEMDAIIRDSERPSCPTGISLTRN